MSTLVSFAADSLSIANSKLSPCGADARRGAVGMGTGAEGAKMFEMARGMITLREDRESPAQISNARCVPWTTKNVYPKVSSVGEFRFHREIIKQALKRLGGVPRIGRHARVPWPETTSSLGICFRKCAAS